MAVTQAQVAQLYVALFNRAAEGEGLRNWMADGANKTVAQLADSMLQAPAVRRILTVLSITIKTTSKRYIKIS